MKWPPQHFEFKITNARTGSISHVTVVAWGPDKHALLLDQIDEIDIFGDKLLVLGRSSANLSEADVLMLPSGMIVDQFPCFMPTVSPSHQFVAFLKAFPGHPGPVSVSAEYIVYDIANSPDSNRRGSKHGVSHDAGLPVYPPGATNAPSSNLLPGPDLPVHWIASEHLYWLDSMTLAFADRYGRDVTLVVANLSRGFFSPQVRTAVLSTSELVDLGRCRNRYSEQDMKKISDDPSAVIRLREISPSAERPGYICLGLEANPCLRTLDVMVKQP